MKTHNFTTLLILTNGSAPIDLLAGVFLWNVVFLGRLLCWKTGVVDGGGCLKTVGGAPSFAGGAPSVNGLCQDPTTDIEIDSSGSG